MSRTQIDPSAFVQHRNLLSPGTRISNGARLLGNVETGEGVLIDSNALIFGPVKIGPRTYIGSNSILGYPDSKELKNLLISSSEIVDKKITSIGDDCTVRPGSAIYSDVTIANNVVFGHNVLIRERVQVGENTKLGTNVVVDGEVKIGSRVSIQTGVYICTFSTIEDSVFLGPCCVLTNDKYVTQKAFKLVGPTIKKGASIGANALIFPGITVGEGAVVGSQALVNKDVPPRTVVAGIPAKKIKKVPLEWRSSLLGN